jgi:uncharacterized protein
MLISFSLRNFLSFKDRYTFSFEATSDKRLEATSVIQHDKLRLLKTAAIYGPNASGKSNFIVALAKFKSTVTKSASEGQVNERIEVLPFLLSSETEGEPSYFEIEFVSDKTKYRYGFEADGEKVHSEWLFRRKPQAKEVTLFTREKDAISPSPEHFKEGSGLAKRTRPNALFLSVCAQFNGEIATVVVSWISNIRITFSYPRSGALDLTADYLQDERYREEIVKLARSADLGISGLSVTELENPSALSEAVSNEQEEKKKSSGAQRTRKIAVSHAKFDARNRKIGVVEFNLKGLESRGTDKYVTLLGAICRALRVGGLLVIDEFESRLHPMLTRAILSLFQGANNTGNAQLLIATHDTHLMDPDFLRRDQIWFTEKNEYGASSLFSLSEFDPQKVRSTSRFDQQYLLGIFGAVPKICLTSHESPQTYGKAKQEAVGTE